MRGQRASATAQTRALMTRKTAEPAPSPTVHEPHDGHCRDAPDQRTPSDERYVARHRAQIPDVPQPSQGLAKEARKGRRQDQPPEDDAPSGTMQSAERGDAEDGLGFEVVARQPDVAASYRDVFTTRRTVDIDEIDTVGVHHLDHGPAGHPRMRRPFHFFFYLFFFPFCVFHTRRRNQNGGTTKNRRVSKGKGCGASKENVETKNMPSAIPICAPAQGENEGAIKGIFFSGGRNMCVGPLVTPDGCDS